MARKKNKTYKILWALAALIALPVGFNVLSMFMQKRYTAEMRLMVDQSTQTTQEISNPFQEFDDIQSAARPRSPQTQLDILTGTVVLEDAVRMASDRLPDKIKDQGKEGDLYESLVRRLQVDNQIGSDVLSIKVTDEDPDVSAELANDIGLAYIDYTKRLAKEAGTLLSDQLKSRIDPLRAHLTKIDETIGQLKAKSNVYDVAAAEANIGATKETADRSLAAAQAQYEGARAQLAVGETELKGIPQYVNASSHTQINPLVVSLQQSLAAESVQLAQLQAQYQDNFPTVREEKRKMADIQKQLKSAKQSVESGEDRTINPIYQSQITAVTSLRAEVQGFASQLIAARAEQQRASTSLGAIPKAEQSLQGLLRDRTVTEQTYEQLQQRLSVIQANGMAREPSSEIVSSAIPPVAPSFPDHKMLTMAGLALGVFLAVLILMPRPDVVLNLVGDKLEEPASPRPSPAPELEESKAAAAPVTESSVPAPKTFADAINRATSAPALSAEEFEALGSLSAKKRG